MPVVDAPDRRYLWILSRTPHLDEPTYQRLICWFVLFISTNSTPLLDRPGPLSIMCPSVERASYLKG